MWHDPRPIAIEPSYQLYNLKRQYLDVIEKACNSGFSSAVTKYVAWVEWQLDDSQLADRSIWLTGKIGKRRISRQ